jgi:hypothetical protein
LAETKSEKEVKFAQKVKARVTKLGSGPDAKVEVKLKDGRKLKGYVSQINEDGFVVIDKTGVSTEIPYPQTKQVKGHNLSTGVKIGIGIGIAILVLVLVGYALGSSE